MTLQSLAAVDRRARTMALQAGDVPAAPSCSMPDYPVSVDLLVEAVDQINAFRPPGVVSHDFRCVAFVHEDLWSLVSVSGPSGHFSLQGLEDAPSIPTIWITVCYKTDPVACHKCDHILIALRKTLGRRCSNGGIAHAFNFLLITYRVCRVNARIGSCTRSPKHINLVNTITPPNGPRFPSASRRTRSDIRRKNLLPKVAN